MKGKHTFKRRKGENRAKAKLENASWERFLLEVKHKIRRCGQGGGQSAQQRGLLHLA